MSLESTACGFTAEQCLDQSGDLAGLIAATHAVNSGSRPGTNTKDVLITAEVDANE